MVNLKVNSALNHYNKVGKVVSVDGASPHRLIQMLLEGALTRIAGAQGYMRRREVAAKGEQISQAISIIDGLRGSLDREKGSEIADNLDGLYDYMMRRLVQANMSDDLGILDEVRALLRQVKEAWDGIAEPTQAADQASMNTPKTPHTPFQSDGIEEPKERLSVHT
jgi:flagellar protein FliS